jgi:hypothetical protein
MQSPDPFLAHPVIGVGMGIRTPLFEACRVCISIRFSVNKRGRLVVVPCCAVLRCELVVPSWWWLVVVVILILDHSTRT